MTAKLFSALCFFFLFGLTSAQSYQIRVTNNTNLRASYSLDSAVLSSAQAGETLQVLGQHNRWLQVSRDSRSYWMAGWVAHSRVEDQPTTPATDIDNCCFLNWRCHSDDDWRHGWLAFQNDQCRLDLPITIEGGEAFRELIFESLLLLWRRSPSWYQYTIDGLDTVAETNSYDDTFINYHTRVFYFHTDDTWSAGLSSQEHLAYTASILVHEACHVHRHEAGFAYQGWQAREEGACTQMQLEAYEAIDPAAPRSPWLRELLANIENPEYQWWE